ncbi:maintenance of telomere capping protein 1 [Limtongia smithiae]|uniref:maintenance of telomere capping protein 1 n=1 Tax=Limtongia smithiae TaxID=1125753 RepID=UPI0034CD10C7
MASPTTSHDDDEDVLDFLESLTHQPGSAASASDNAAAGTATSPLPQSAEGPTTAAGAESEKELLGFLDSLAQETAAVPASSIAGSPSSSPPVVVKIEDAAPAVSPVDAPKAKPSTPIPASVPVVPVSPASPVAGVSASLSSWFGGAKATSIWDTASAAVKGAESRVRDIQQTAASAASAASAAAASAAATASAAAANSGVSVDAASWENKVKGNISALNRFGISKTLASTFSSVLQTIAPPILRHEQLRIHIFHDIVGYPAIDTIAYSVFDRVMQQVEGGELIIVQKGRESRRRDSDWKGVKRDMGLIQGGLESGEKLCKANIEQIKALSKDTEDEDSEESPIRKSDIYLSIQACAYTSDAEEKLFTFIIYLDDPHHGLSFLTHSQSFPLQWCEWLDSNEAIPGQVDPREWLAEWVEEGLGLGIGIVAQRYVASRMAVGVDVGVAA